MLYLQIESPKSSVLNFLDSNSFEVIISIFQRTEKVPDMERLQSTKYSPLDSEQIRHEYRSCDRSQLHFFQFCGNAAHTITAFAQTKSALHFDSIDIILVLLFFSACAVAFGLPSFGPDNRIPCSLQ